MEVEDGEDRGQVVLAATEICARDCSLCAREDQFPIPILASPTLDLAPEQSQFEPALLDGDKFDLSASARGSVNAWRPAAFTTRPRGAAPA